MPVVPISSTKPKSGSRSVADLRPPPATPFALMAAAQMHDEGRLLPPREFATGDRNIIDPESRGIDRLTRDRNEIAEPGNRALGQEPT
jgi:hypothetical protein